MGNVQSISCCAPCRKSDTRRQRANVPQAEKLKEHLLTSHIPKCSRKYFVKNGKSPRDISTPLEQQNIEREIEEIELEIKKEVEMKKAAQKLQNVITKKKHLKEVNNFLEQTTKNLELLHARLQVLNAQVVVQEVADLPGSGSSEEIFYTALSTLEIEKEHLQLPLSVCKTPIAEVKADQKPEEPLDSSASSSNYESAVESPDYWIQKELTQVSGRTNQTAKESQETDKNDNILKVSDDQSIQQKSTVGFEDFQFHAVLGRGTFGKVLLAEWRVTNKLVAVKTMKKVDFSTSYKINRLHYEKHILETVSSTHHPFLVNLYASFQTIERIFFVMEYAAGGDLETNLKNSWGRFDEPRAVFYAACIVLGLEQLHKLRIVHRDLKTENVLIDQDGYAKITDFGLSKTDMGYGDRASTRCGTLPYAAPEIIEGPSYTRAVDWWSAGCLIYKMLARKTPFTGIDYRQIARNIVKAEVCYPEHLSKEAKSVIKKLLRKDPKKRLGASKKGAKAVKKHSFFRNIKWVNLLEKKVEPPFYPFLLHPKDTRNFDIMATSEAPVLSNLQEPDLTLVQKEAFQDFDWVADWAK